MIVNTNKIFSIPTVEVDVQKNKFYLPQSSINVPVCQHFLVNRYFEPNTHELIKEILKKKPGNIIHAGTFFGDMLPSFSKACGKNKVYAFEPILENFFLSKKVIEVNLISNVFLFCAALSEELNLVKMKTSENNISLGGGSKISDTGDETVCTICIDQLGIENLSCIQLDVEGHELPALKGAINTIKEYKPIILIEDYSISSDGLVVNEKICNEFLLSIDYVFVKRIPGLSLWKYKKENLFTSA